MKQRVIVMFAMFALLFGSVLPAYAARGGGGHGGGGGGGRFAGGGARGGSHFAGGGHWNGGGHWRGGWHGGWRGGWRGGGCCWWPGVALGGVALGAALAYPYYAYGYPYGYPYPYPAYGQPAYAQPTVIEEAPVAYQGPPVQREVVYPNGRYVLYGDGASQPWQWVWVPNAPPPATQQ